MTAFSRAAALAAMVVASATPALAATVYNTSLQNLNGTAGTSTYTTSTTATGTTTTTTGPGPNADANRAHGATTLNSWYQDNVGAGTTVGITTNYARSGNGSAYFNQAQAQTGKADLQYYFGNSATGAVTPIALSSLTSYSYDYLRDSASTTTAWLTPVLRLNILKDGVFAGTLIWEAVYNLGNGPAATDTWLTGAGNLTTGNFWTNNALLGPPNATAGGTKTLAQWIADNSGSTLSVYGIQVGFGSGWEGTFSGAADNVNIAFGQTVYNTNFEVAAATSPVPEPATWSMMIIGFGAVGASMRYRRRTSAVAFG